MGQLPRQCHDGAGPALAGERGCAPGCGRPGRTHTGDMRRRRTPGMPWMDGCRGRTRAGCGRTAGTDTCRRRMPRAVARHGHAPETNTVDQLAPWMEVVLAPVFSEPCPSFAQPLHAHCDISLASWLLSGLRPGRSCCLRALQERCLLHDERSVLACADYMSRVRRSGEGRGGSGCAGRVAGRSKLCCVDSHH